MTAQSFRGTAPDLGPDPRFGNRRTDLKGPRVPRQRGDDQDEAFESVLAAPVAAVAASPAPDLMAETTVSATPVVVTSPPVVRGSRSHRQAHLFAAQVLAVLVAGLVVASVGPDPLAGVIVLLFSLALKYYAGPSLIRPGMPHLGRLVTDMALPLAAVAVGVAYWLPEFELRNAVVIVAAVNGVDLAANLVRRWLKGPLRIVVVGDHTAIARASDRRAIHPHVEVVGGLLLTSDLGEQEPENSAIRVCTIRGIGEVVDWVERWAADMVVLTPGPGVSSAELRTLSWDLEHVDASLAVSGVLDSVAPHRIESTRFAGSTLIHARSSRPSAYIRAVKWTVDRVLGTLLLALAAPVIALCCLCIRLDSSGPGLFKQVRVGQGGRPFRMYKLRTMHTDAEAAQAALGSGDGGGVLFKLFKDPRVTRIGRFLRKSSMDELPQLINVALGQMSLVGPRPALPGEVEKYDDHARRRMVVRPGMTGLWQVSGRSDLGWAESVELDLHYTDNYRLSNDLLIGLRTVKAVARSKGAY
ncbi:MAG: exopolysaccharide biosynthesis polyprenyl glycosylphosphotransferase [Marmoricola sp.]